MNPAYAEAAKIIPGLVDEYMRLLGLSGDGPVVEVKDNIGSKWLGRTTLKNNEIWIEIQARATEDPETLEKILAHEMAHFAEMSTFDEHDVAAMRFKRLAKFFEHGEKFWRFANMINAVKGDDFVTKTSDARYELAKNTRPFFMVVGKDPRGYWWRWAAKRTPGIDVIIRRLEDGGAVLVESTDEQFLSGAKMGKGKIGSSMARAGSDKEAALQEIYDEARARTPLTKNEMATLVLGYWEACDDGKQSVDGAVDLVQSEIGRTLSKEEIGTLEQVFSEC